MAQAPKKKRLLPKNILDKSDSDIAEKVFGKRVKRELDRIVDASKKSISEC